MPIATRKLVKPPALRPGDTVGIVAPASNVKQSDLEAGCQALSHCGYKPFYLDSIFERDLYFAGSATRRARELEEMFEREEVRAILCARGGYGANYLLKEIDLKKITSHPKIFLGYSDITSLLTHILDAGLVSFHGPMVAKDWSHANGVDLESFTAALTQTSAWNVPLDGVIALAEGEAEGTLYGGCLSILVASLGTPYEIRTEGTILFLEDLAAKPYQIDRMLMQLKLAGKLEKVRGLVFGEMLDCIQAPNQDYTLPEVITRIVGELGIPVAYGLKSGHVTSNNITLPLGVRAKLQAEKQNVSLRVLESAVT
ncbi:MAG TPA: LD-carboxypeptidase [Candidatus Sulfotelmatobacter sp.]|nr:LD-carboxypeptidase [Candidatus Sulfotelmatobacter sp.]